MVQSSLGPVLKLGLWDTTTFSNHSSSCNWSSDQKFGPFNACRFDFTLLFEQSVLSLLPAAVLLLAFLPRTFQLVHESPKVVGNYVGVIKLLLSLINAAFQLALVVLWVSDPTWTTKASIPSAVCNLAAALGSVLLTYQEHKRSIRPSFLLETYLFFSTVLDIPQARTLFLLHNNLTIAVTFVSSIVLRGVWLCVEARSKVKYLKVEYRHISPEATAGFINRSLLYWLNGLLFKGSNQILKWDDLYDLDPALSAAYWREKATSIWSKSVKKHSRLSLVLAIWLALWRPLSYAIFPRLCSILFKLLQPVLIAQILTALEDSDGEISGQIYSLVVATGVIYLGIAISNVYTSQNLRRVLAMFRSATVSLVYDQSLKLQNSADRDTSQAMTLMSSDVGRIADALELFNDCWSNIIQLVVGMCLLTLELGWVSVMPLVVVFASTAAATIPARRLGDTIKNWSAATQARVSILSSFLKEIKNVKMTGLTNIVDEQIVEKRTQETERMKDYAWIVVLKNLIANVPFVAAPAATFIVYAVQAYLRGEDQLDTTKAFTSLALINLVCDPAILLLLAFPDIASTVGCFDRIQDFLWEEHRTDQRACETSSTVPRAKTTASATGLEAEEDYAIKVDGLVVRPSPKSDIILSEVSLNIHKGSLVAICGPVGSGKSVFLRAVLGELPYESGSIWVETKHIAYCSQTTWLPHTTVRQVICGLTENEDNIIDEQWYQTVLEACALDYDLKTFPNGQNTQVGTKGSMLSGGQKQRISLARALYSRPSIILLDDVLSALDRKTGSHIIDRVFGPNGLLRNLGCTTVMATHGTHHLAMADHIVVFSAVDTSIKQGTYEELSRAGVIDVVEAQSFAEDTNTKQDLDFTEPMKPDSPGQEEPEVSILTRQSGDWSLYSYYFKHVGLTLPLLFFCFAILHTLTSTFSFVIVKFWSDAEGHHMILFGSIYVALAILYSVTHGLYSWTMLGLLAGSAGQRLHAVLLQTVSKASYKFLSKTDIGTLIARFSNDIEHIELPLAVGLMLTIKNLLVAAGEAALIATGSTYMAAALPFLGITVYLLQHVYLQTSRQLRLLDLESRSPLYSHFLETLEGLVTIRAFGWETLYTTESDRRLDYSQKPAYLLASVQSWLALALDLIVGFMAVVVVSLALSLRHSTSAGLLGISLNAILGFNISLSQFIGGWTHLESSIGSVGRIRDFAATVEPEVDSEEVDPPVDWPQQGSIQLSHVSASYNSSNQILHDISLEVPAGTRLAICGRTGSGKSSMILTILRLLEYSGTIIIDGVDICKISRELLRGRLTTLPQDPLNIAGFTVRQTIDPFGISSSDAIVEILKKVNLWNSMSQYPLDTPFNPEILSKGQQQLLALARALVQHSKILILDEATSSVDLDTERTMRRIIKEEFQDCTIITIAHRLETILDSDLVVMMEAGRIVDSGSPTNLAASQRLKDFLGQ